MKSKDENAKTIKLTDFLNSEDIELIKKLDIEIEEKAYTESEYEFIIFQLLRYYTDEDEQRRFKKEDFKYLKSLDEKNVSRDAFNKVLKKVINIVESQSKN